MYVLERNKFDAEINWSTRESSLLILFAIVFKYNKEDTTAKENRGFQSFFSIVREGHFLFWLNALSLLVLFT